MKIISVFFGLFLIYSCSSNADQGDLIQIKSDIESQWGKFIQLWEKEEASSCANIFSKDGILIPSGASVSNGRDQIASFYQNLFDDNISSKYQVEIEEIEFRDSFLIDRGIFSVDWLGNDSTKTRFQAKSIARWSKDETGQWHIDEFMFEEIQ